MSSDKFFVDTISETVGGLLAADDRGDKIPLVTATIEAVLTPAHLAEYAEAYGSLETTVKSDERDVNVLRVRHQEVARLLASGLPEGLVAEFTNFTPSYLSVLKKSPSMLQLIEHYRAPGNAAAYQIGERLRTAGSAALERLLTKLEKGELSTMEELALAKLGFDRSGHGPQTTTRSVNENYNTDVAEVMKLARTSRVEEAGRIRPIEEIRRALPAPAREIDDAA